MAAAQSAAAACADGESTALQSLLRWAAGALLAAGAAAIAIPHEPARCDAGGMPAPSAEPPPSPDELETMVCLSVPSFAKHCNSGIHRVQLLVEL
jgi:hypothetical protein